jgi:hypothetical protein
MLISFGLLLLLDECARVHEFNVESILATFMPYHESPHFAKMLAILHIR